MIMGVGQMIDAGQQAAEGLAVGDDAADGDAAEADAVIAALAPDQPRARALAADAVIGDRHLEGGVDRFRSGIGEEDMVEIRAQQIGEARGEFEDRGMAHLEGRRVVEAADLIAHRFHDLAPAMAGIDAPEARRAVQHLAALDGGVMHVLGAGEEARLGLELPVRGERHPEGFEIVRGALEDA